MADILLGLSPADGGALLEAALDGVARALNEALNAAAGRIRDRVAEAAGKAIADSPEYRSLVGGQLRHELGVADAEGTLAEVVANIQAGIVVTPVRVRRSGSGLEGGLRVELLKSDYSEALRAKGVSFTSEGGYEIDWLRWLTLEGDRVLVSEHSFVGGYEARSRTGYGVMRRPGNWRVPPEFSGTGEDNWLTRALGGIAPEVERILAEELQGGP